MQLSGHRVRGPPLAWKFGNIWSEHFLEHCSEGFTTCLLMSTKSLTELVWVAPAFAPRQPSAPEPSLAIAHVPPCWMSLPSSPRRPKVPSSSLPLSLHPLFFLSSFPSSRSVFLSLPPLIYLQISKHFFFRSFLPLFLPSWLIIS